MRYEIEFRPRALRDLQRLSPDISRRIERKLELLRQDLSGDVKKLVGHASGWRLRVGDWRVLFERERELLVVHRIVHRSEAYDWQEPCMLKLKAEIWTNSRGRRFVVLPEEDFAQISELIEDAGLARILREAKEADRGGPGIPFAEVKRLLAARRRRKTRTRT